MHHAWISKAYRLNKQDNCFQTSSLKKFKIEMKDKDNEQVQEDIRDQLAENTSNQLVREQVETQEGTRTSKEIRLTESISF